jgi:hypothetical protein
MVGVRVGVLDSVDDELGVMVLIMGLAVRVGMGEALTCPHPTSSSVSISPVIKRFIILSSV